MATFTWELTKADMLNPATIVSLNTTRLVCNGPGGGKYGTGYHYTFKVGENNVPAIVTNKHVVEGATHVSLDLQLMPQGGTVNEDCTVEGEVRQSLTIELFDGNLIPHPDPNVDLCAILMGPIVNSLPKGYDLKIFALSAEWHLQADDIERMRPVEPILMIGYPNGLWDEQNNRPIVRQGLTASHALLPWNGARHFMIDAACFPGSSGSPVYLFEDGMIRTAGNGYMPGTRAKFLGTLWGGPMITAEGEMIPRPIPTSATVPAVPLMMNLGYVIHASALHDFVEVIRQKFNLS